MVLSPHFKLRELCHSDMAEEKGIVNIPPDHAIDLAQKFCKEVLEPIREKWGAVYINSGYRCPQLNRLVHGVPSSEHIWSPERCAVDIALVQPLVEVYDWLRLESKLPFDQVILEKDKETGIDRCIHVGYAVEPRREALRGGTHGSLPYEPDTVIA